MATIIPVTTIDDCISLKTVLVSCSNKDGLVSNRDSSGQTMAGVPQGGLLGFLYAANPSIRFVATGGTWSLLKEQGLPVVEVAELTGYPEMESGLVKSLHPVIHAGLLAHPHTPSDHAFMEAQGIAYIDALIVNFYPLDQAMEAKSNFEIIRQNIDVGGPSMSHNARKAFIRTALITNPDSYGALIAELAANNNRISLARRIALAKEASRMITEYMLSVDRVVQGITMESLKATYDIR